MSWFILLIIAVILLCSVYIYTIQFSYRKMPPGPINLPIFGIFHAVFLLKPWWTMRPKDFVHFKAYEYFHKASKLYGPVYSGQLGGYTGVVFASYEVLKEVENMDEYSIKVSNELTVPRSMGEELGLIFAATPELWMEMRKFSQRTLRDFGFGKRYSMQSVIELEICDIVQEIKEEIKKTDGVLRVRTNFLLSVLNVLWCMIAGQRYAHDDPKLVKMLEKNFAMTKAQTFFDPHVIMTPFLRKIFPTFFKYDLVNKVFEESHEFSRSLIEERKEEGMYLSEPQNYIDCFLKKIDENLNSNNNADDQNNNNNRSSKPVYNYKNLQIMIEDFMQTGSTTTNGTLNYALLFLTLNPSVQKKCQEEIDSIVPRNLVPTLDDIEKMPYFQATILESHRLGNVVPIPIPRQAPKDWHYRGYIIPKGAVIISNHYSVHMDEDYWGDPHAFRPDRFINDKGEFVPDKRVCQFGFGKRYCIGVTLANSVVPIYIATLLQNFTFGVIPGADPPTMEPEVGVSLSPQEFSARVIERA